MQTIKDLKQYTFPALMRNSLKKFAERPALSFASGEPLTYREITVRAKKIAEFLQKLNIKKGDKVAIFSTSMPNWGAAYFGIVNMGAITVPLLPDFSSTEVETILKHGEVSVVLVGNKLKSKIADLPDEICPIVVKLDDLSIIKNNSGIENPVFDDSLEGDVFDLTKELDTCCENVAEEDTASIIYTSGTTGRSKGVELTHKNLVWTSVFCQGVHRVNTRDKCLSFLPLSHVYEFTIGFTMQMLNGSCVYYLEKPPAVSSLLPALKRVRPTIVLSVPMVLEKVYKNKVLPTFNKNEKIKKLYKKPFFRKIMNRVAGKQLKKSFGGRINFFGVGGAKMDTQVEYFLKEAKFPYAIGYGLTETSPLLAGSNPKETIPGTLGPVLGGVKVAISNPDPKTGVGEIVAKGPNVMKGYYKDPELTAEAFTTEEDSVGPGWFKTGDLGLLHNGIWLELKGRLKNMILSSSGENIYPEDIEFVLNQHPLISDSLVVEDDGNLVALVQLDEEKIKKEGNGGFMSKIAAVGADLTEGFLYKEQALIAEIKYFVNEKVNKMSKISDVEFIEKFDKTASQKIKRYVYKNFKKNRGTAEKTLDESSKTEETKSEEKK